MSKKTIGIILICFGLFMLLGFTAGNVDAGFAGKIFSFLLLVVAPIAGGVRMLTAQKKQIQLAALERDKLLYAAREKEILRMGRERKQGITVAEVVESSSMNAQEAEDVFHQLIVKGLVQMKMNDRGQVTYYFYEALDGADSSIGNLKEERLTSHE